MERGKAALVPDTLARIGAGRGRQTISSLGHRRIDEIETAGRVNAFNRTLASELRQVPGSISCIISARIDEK